MKTKEEILSTFNTPEGAYWAYRQGLQEGFADMQNALRNQAAIAAMTAIIPTQKGNYMMCESHLKYRDCAIEAIKYADSLVEKILEELKKQK